jgi:hypothetical protein
MATIYIYHGEFCWDGFVPKPIHSDLLALHEDDIQHFEVAEKDMKMYDKWGIYPSNLEKRPAQMSKNMALQNPMVELIIFRHVQKNNASLFNVLHGKFM